MSVVERVKVWVVGSSVHMFIVLSREAVMRPRGQTQSDRTWRDDSKERVSWMVVGYMMGMVLLCWNVHLPRA